MTYDELFNFYQKRYKNQAFTLLVLGSKDRIKTEDLSKYGKVEQITLQDIFGY
jgi:predicted Zn-dependent peptidase